MEYQKNTSLNADCIRKTSIQGREQRRNDTYKYVYET